MLNKSQRTTLQPHLQHLSSSRSRALLTDIYLSFTSATRAILEGFRALISEAAIPDCLDISDPTLPQASTPDVEQQLPPSMTGLRTFYLLNTVCPGTSTHYPVSGRREILDNSMIIDLYARLYTSVNRKFGVMLGLLVNTVVVLYLHAVIAFVVIITLIFLGGKSADQAPEDSA